MQTQEYSRTGMQVRMKKQGYLGSLCCDQRGDYSQQVIRREEGAEAVGLFQPLHLKSIDQHLPNQGSNVKEERNESQNIIGVDRGRFKFKASVHCISRLPLEHVLKSFEHALLKILILAPKIM